MQEQLLQDILAELQLTNSQLQDLNSAMAQQNATLSQINADLLAFRLAYTATVPIQNSYALSTTLGTQPVYGFQSFTVGDLFTPACFVIYITVRLLRIKFGAVRGISL